MRGKPGGGVSLNEEMKGRTRKGILEEGEGVEVQEKAGGCLLGHRLRREGMWALYTGSPQGKRQHR